MANAVAFRVIDTKLEQARKDLEQIGISVIMTDNFNNKVIYKSTGYTVAYWQSYGQWQSQIQSSIGYNDVMKAKMISHHLHYWRMLCEK